MSEAKEIDAALTQLSISGELERARPAIEGLLAGLEVSVRSRVFRQVNSSEEFTAQEALNAWIELHAYNRLRMRLTQALQMGQSAGKTLEPAWVLEKTFNRE